MKRGRYKNSILVMAGHSIRLYYNSNEWTSMETGLQRVIISMPEPQETEMYTSSNVKYLPCIEDQFPRLYLFYGMISASPTTVLGFPFGLLGFRRWFFALSLAASFPIGVGIPLGWGLIRSRPWFGPRPTPFRPWRAEKSLKNWGHLVPHQVWRFCVFLFTNQFRQEYCCSKDWYHTVRFHSISDRIVLVVLRQTRLRIFRLGQEHNRDF